MKELILDTGKEQIVLEVTSARPQKNLVILKFKGIDLSLIHILFQIEKRTNEGEDCFCKSKGYNSAT